MPSRIRPRTIAQASGDSATVAYVPFKFFDFLSPLISVAMAFLGIRMLKAPTAESKPRS
jgi:hypothetical protein